jgi:GlcNAc-PI de-N-acetylase
VTGTGTGTGITPPTAWADAIDEHAPPPMGIPSGRVLVVAAHPDDETLGAGGFLHATSAAGAQIELVAATDGEAAFGAPDPELGRAATPSCAPPSTRSASAMSSSTASACPTPASPTTATT